MVKNSIGYSSATGIYLGGCPNCGGPEGDDRLLNKLPCPRCLPEKIPVESIVDVVEELERRGTLRKTSRLAFYASVEKEARRIEELFEKATGSRLWSAQRSWVRRVLKHRSFAIIAPTGVGKTTFGILMALYFASKCRMGEEWCKSYIVVPTTPLVRMVEEKLRKMAEAAGIDARILSIHSKLSVKERRERLRKLLEGDYDILITTSAFMRSRINEILASVGKAGDSRCERRGFRFVFVDDVDAVLKSSKSVEAVLRIVGFPPNITSREQGIGWKLISLRQRLTRLVERASRRGYDEKLLREIDEVYSEIERLEERVRKCRENAAVLVVSSATGRPRGRMVRLFSILLGFQAGSRSETIRNIVDVYTVVDEKDVEEKVAEIVSKLIARSRLCGGLVYVPVDKGSEYAEKLAAALRAAGVRAEAFTSKNVEALERFRRGELDVLVGVAVYYGVAVRGLDIPERICWAVFAGAPRLKFSARFEDPHPVNILRALALLADHAPRDVAEEAEKRLVRIRRLYQRLSQAAVTSIAEELRSGEAKTPAAREFMDALAFIRKALARRDVWEALEKADDIAIVRAGDKSYILLPDPATYIQASGRTSRLYAGGITKGLSIVVESDYRIMNGLVRRTRWWADVEWKTLDQVDIDGILGELEKSRRELLDVMEGRVKPKQGQELVTTALMIVESPNKARTIANFFGKPSVRDIGPVRVYEVSTGDYVLLIAASGGHVYDLVKPSKREAKLPPTWLVERVKGSIDGVDFARAVNIHGVIAVESGGSTRFYPVYSPLARCLICGTQWPLSPEELEEHLRALEESRPSPLRCPKCGSRLVKTSWDVIDVLRDLASEVDVVLIGTDPDTEGEKIGWDLASLIAPYARSIARIEFHEITRKAILNALRSAKPYGEHKMSVFVRERGEELQVPASNLVKAQIVRRTEDRWIGFTLSPILWSRFWYGKYCQEEAKKLIDTLAKRLGKHYSRFREETKGLKPIEALRYLLALIGETEDYEDDEEEEAGSRDPLKKAIRLVKSCCSNGLPRSPEDYRCIPAVNYNLSAGRVQTPVLGWVVERTIGRKIELPVLVVRVEDLDLTLNINVEELPGEVGKNARNLKEKIEKILGCIDECVTVGCRGDKCSKLNLVASKVEGDYVISKLNSMLSKVKNQVKSIETLLEKVKKREVEVEVEVVEEEVVEVNPPPPYTTDALLADAAAYLRLTPPQAMRIAQDLFELGFITYHRTDSTRVSETGMAIAREYLREVYGEETASKLYQPRSWGTGGAHEAIRPTRPIDADRLRKLVEEGIVQPARPLTRNHYRLYDLVFRRFIASQMKPSKLVKQVARITVRLPWGTVVRQVERYVDVVEKSFLDIYPVVEIEKPFKPGVFRGQVGITKKGFTRLMTDAEIVKMMRSKGIGRPSTYAKIVETLIRRGYIAHVKSKDKIKEHVYATSKGVSVYDYLITLFPNLVSEDVTRQLENEMDKVERGAADYQQTLLKVLKDLKEALDAAGLSDYSPTLLS